MGRDKAWLPFGSQRMLQHVVAVVGDAVDEVIVVARPGQELPTLPDDVRVVRDEVPDQGPLGGLVPGLRAVEGDAFATSCDVPFLRPALIDLLFEQFADHDVAVAESEGFTHPLCAVYRRSVVEPLSALLAAGRLRPVFLYDEVPTARVGEDALRRVDPDLSSLRNLNDEDAYTAALRDAFPMVTIELFDLARARSGVAEAHVHADTIHGALLALADRHPSLVPDVLDITGCPARHWRVSLDAMTFVDDLDIPLEADARLVLLSALAGG